MFFVSKRHWAGQARKSSRMRFEATDPGTPTGTGGGEVLGAPHITGLLAEGRPSSHPAVSLARQRVASALFGQPPPHLGRFQLLHKLGAGGMGVVHAAYDPELQRVVALKVIQVSGPERAGELARREGQALARLAHPHVVPVFDVGAEGEHVFIVMELVRGQTLRRWVAGRSPSEILRVYRQAGLALAAAHAAGLVHRDFKPDNALVGEDGRVRVVDFGLACEPRAMAPGGAGTPRYMAPEQLQGESPGPAADQYSFCRALDEALEATPESSAPRWVRPILARGLAEDPRRRYASMDQLLAALARDEGSRRRRWTAALLGAAIVTTFVAGHLSRGDRRQECAKGAERLAASVNPSRETLALARLNGLGPYGPGVRAQLQRMLDAWRARWADEYQAACLDHRDGVNSAALLDLRMACLDRGRTALGAVAGVIETAETSQLAGLPLAVHALPPPGACADLNALKGETASPGAAAADPTTRELTAGLAAARVQIAAGRYRQGAAAAEALGARARARGLRAVVAEAQLVKGQALLWVEPRGDAVAPLDEALRLALENGRLPLAVEAWARRAWAAGTSGARPDALAGMEVIEALARRSPEARFERALLYNNAGSVELALGRPDRARAAFESALREAGEVTGAGAVELMNIRINLALLATPARGEQLLEEAEQRLAALLGPSHPRALEVRWIRGARTSSLRDAAAVLGRTCPALEEHPDQTDRTGRCWAELAFVLEELGQETSATAALAQAARLDRSVRAAIPELQGYLALRTGEAADAVEIFAEALRAHALGERSLTWWEQARRGALQLGHAESLLASGASSAGRKALATSVTTLSAVVDTQDTATTSRRLNRARRLVGQHGRR